MPAHSGDGSVKVSIDTTNGDQISRLYRRITDNKDAYYSAWFYLNEDHNPQRLVVHFLVSRRARSQQEHRLVVG